MRFVIIFLTIFVSFNLSCFSKEMVFSLPAKESANDKRYEHDFNAVQLALEKTKEKYGPYTIKRLKTAANFKRFEKVAADNNEENFFFKQSMRKDIPLACVPFPVDLGIVGYRIAFLSKQLKEKVSKVSSLEELRKFSIVQGPGWLDNDILKFNKFNVIVGNSYEGLFKMVAGGRGDLFTRGANEIYSEWQSNKSIKDFDVDESFSLYYPLPRFFCTNKKNKMAYQRIHEGLIKAYQDGSFLKLWKKSYKESLEFVQLEKRRIFRIENPFIEGIDPSYKKYIYNPLKK